MSLQIVSSLCELNFIPVSFLLVVVFFFPAQVTHVKPILAVQFRFNFTHLGGSKHS